MFRKLVANISFSPSLIGRLAQYSKELEQKQKLQFAGTIGLFLLLCLLLATTLFLPESSNQANPRDLFYGGFSDKADVLTKYDNNNAHIKELYLTLGIHRADIEASREHTHYTYAPKSGSYVVTSTNSPIASSHDARLVTYTDNKAALATSYDPQETKHLRRLLVGHSTSGEFAIILDSGNVIVSKVPNTNSPTQCSSLQTNDSPRTTDCKDKIAFNTYVNNSADNTIAQPSDKLSYKIVAKNTTKSPIQVSFTDNISDLLEYATVVDAGGAQFNSTTASLQWQDSTINAGQSRTYTFSARIKPHTPATPQGASSFYSYDCHITNGVGETTTVQIACPLQRELPNVLSHLPYINSDITIAAMGVITLVNLYLLLRTRQQKEEIRLIRHDINSGDL